MDVLLCWDLAVGLYFALLVSVGGVLWGSDDVPVRFDVDLRDSSVRFI